LTTDIAVRARELEPQALTFSERARALTIIDQATYGAVIELMRGIKDLRLEAENHHRPVIDAAHKTHKAALAALQRIDDPLKQGEFICKGKIGTWEMEQRRIEEEARRKAEEEARRAQEAERQRLALELEKARLAAEEAKMAAAMEAEVAGASIDAITAILEQPDTVVEEMRAVLEQPIVMPAIQIAPTYERASGVSIAKRYKAEVFDIKLLAAAVGRGEAVVNLIEANQSALNAMARASKGSIKIPGVRCVEDSTVRSGGRR
jgi:hypothetical protein